MTRNLGKCETHISLFTSICYERKHVSDLLMLVFCFCSHTFVVYLQTTKVHSNQHFQGTHPTLSTPEIPPVKCPHAFGFPIVNTPPPPPMPSEFHNCEAPLLNFGNPKSRPWYRYGYFLESPIINWEDYHHLKEEIILMASAVKCGSIPSIDTLDRPSINIPSTP